MHTPIRPMSLCIAAVVLAGCDGTASDGASLAWLRAKPPVVRATAPAPSTAQPRARQTACAMLTSGAMSAVVGAAVHSEPEEGRGTTKCLYAPAAGGSPRAEIQIDWGNGEAAMMGSGMLGQAEPGLADPLAGLGDQASRIGPVLWVRVGRDLVMLTLYGVDDPVTAAKRIVAALRPHLS